jgi:hypothetical protein
VGKIPDNKIVANVSTWGTIDSLTIESSDPDFIIASIEKLKAAMPSHGPPTKKTQG